MYSSSQDTHALIWGLFFLQTREAKLEIELSFVTLPRWQLYISSSSHNHQNPFTYLLGLSKGNAGVEIPAFFFPFGRKSQSSSRMRNFFSLTDARRFL